MAANAGASGVACWCWGTWSTVMTDLLGDEAEAEDGA